MERDHLLKVRISQAGIAAIDERAVGEERTRSDVVRLMLKFAVEFMPRGWPGNPVVKK